MKKNRASIALISLLVISAFTLILVVGMSEVNLSKSYQYLNNTSDKTAYYIAEGCLEEAMIRLENNTSFAGTTLTLDADTNCSVSVTGTTISITVNHLDYTQTFEGEVSVTQEGTANNISLQYWNET